jgi:hypothetical protein
MNDYKQHKLARGIPDWAKVVIGLTLGLPTIYFLLVVLFSY